VKTLALFGDVVPRGGGTQIISGSHRLVRSWFQDNPPPTGAHRADMRKLLQSNPYIRDLHTAGDREGRIARFMNRVEEEDGIALQVVETTGSAGDVIILHPLILHVATPNKAAEPRFLLSGGITTDMWGWG
jgi:ectoine hydroxylase-related dioxygenase (phytanoyl-CoA dioxygenase family)